MKSEEVRRPSRNVFSLLGEPSSLRPYGRETSRRRNAQLASVDRRSVSISNPTRERARERASTSVSTSPGIPRSVAEVEATNIPPVKQVEDPVPSCVTLPGLVVGHAAARAYDHVDTLVDQAATA